jgi:hypothetical protein
MESPQQVSSELEPSLIGINSADEGTLEGTVFDNLNAAYQRFSHIPLPQTGHRTMTPPFLQ